jgi:NhaP-type Na+/H+ or K+/H+ antiporter
MTVMYEDLAILAVLLFLYSQIVGRVEGAPVSGPLIFVVLGLITGPTLLGWFAGSVTTTEYRVLTDLTLAFILFVDAANADLKTLRRQIQLPARMLLIGLPAIIGLGFVLALLLFDQLSIFEAAILATMLAATDAALGKGVITNPAVPVRVRESLNAESGLNDGLCVPILFVFIALAEGAGADSKMLAFTLVAEELGIGLAVGLAGTWLADKLMRYCWDRGWMPRIWSYIATGALAIALFAIAQSLHGSGYIAAFSGGLLFGHLAGKDTEDLLHSAEVNAETLSLLTWFLFGAVVIALYAETFTLEVLLYAMLSLTVIRVLPIFLSLMGTGESVSNRLFMGWFGPRGLASIVFAIIVLNKELPGSEFMAGVVTCTVLLSLIAHGISANPLAARLARTEARLNAKDPNP